MEIMWNLPVVLWAVEVLYSFLATVCAPHLDGAERLPWIVGRMSGYCHEDSW